MAMALLTMAACKTKVLVLVALLQADMLMTPVGGHGASAFRGVFDLLMPHVKFMVLTTNHTPISGNV